MSNKKRINLIVKGALLGAIAMVIKYFIDIPVLPGVIHIRPHVYIVYASGFLFGPVLGGVVGFISDFGAMFKWGPNIFTIASILTGVVPGLFYLKKGKMSILRVAVASAISYVILSMFVMTYVITVYNGGVGFMETFMIRLPKSIEVVAYILLMPILYNFLYDLEHKK
jgi:ECF transporter S component (folate family)